MAIFVFKIMTVVIKTVAKPIIQWVTFYNKQMLQEQNTKLKTIKNIIIYIGQSYNYFNVKLNRKLFGLSKADVIKPLSNEKAIEKGAEFLSEFLIYSIIIIIPIIELIKNNNASKELEFLRQEKVKKMKNEIEILEQKNENLRKRLNEIKLKIEEMNLNI